MEEEMTLFQKLDELRRDLRETSVSNSALQEAIDDLYHQCLTVQTLLNEHTGEP